MTNTRIKFAGGSPAAITNDLASVFCWVSQMASSSISHFFLLRQRKSNQKEGDPGLPPFGFPALLDWSGGCGTRAARSDSPCRNPLTSLRYSAALRGGQSETQNPKPKPKPKTVK